MENSTENITAILTNFMEDKKGQPFSEKKKEVFSLAGSVFALGLSRIKRVGAEFAKAIRKVEIETKEAFEIAYPNWKAESVGTPFGSVKVSKASSYGKNAYKMTLVFSSTQKIDDCKVTRFTVEEILVRADYDLVNYTYNELGTATTRKAQGKLVDTDGVERVTGLQIELTPIMPRG